MNLRILVTGATGFLGSAVVRHFLSKDYSVIATGRKIDKLNFAPSKYLIVKQAELSNEKEVKNLVEGCDAIVHCAALAAPWGKKNNFYLSNVLSTRLICKYALQNRIKKFIHISTPSIYMGMKKNMDILESDPIIHKLTSEYAITKKMAEDIVDNYYLNGLPVLTLRPQGLFGPHDPTIMPRLVRINEKIGIPLLNHGSHKIDLTYIDNVVHAIHLALNADASCFGQKYNITNDEPVEFYSFICHMFHKMEITPKFRKIPKIYLKCLAIFFEKFYHLCDFNQEPPVTRYAVDALSQSRTLSINAAKKDLYYKPLISMQEGIERYAKWWLLQS